MSQAFNNKQKHSASFFLGACMMSTVLPLIIRTFDNFHIVKECTESDAVQEGE